MEAGRSYPWLFSAPVDLGVFLGSAIGSLLLLALGARLGVLDGDTPDWGWVPAVLLIDVAHVYATGFRVYLDTAELKRRPWLYFTVPLAGYVLALAVYSEGENLFWRALAYLAVFHFVRQQYGWVALYRTRAGETGRVGRWIDNAAIYMATLYPLLYWHGHLPREYWWFRANDFTSLPEVVSRIAQPFYWLALAAYSVKSVYGWVHAGDVNPGKDVVVATTAVCWYAGIIAFNSDYAFTVTNVIIHGVPYFALVYWYARSRHPEATVPYRFLTRNLLTFLGALWLLAYAEEMLWDRGVWNEHQWLFGRPWDLGEMKTFVVPLLALPQITHYLLDGFIWRRRSNPELTLLSPIRD